LHEQYYSCELFISSKLASYSRPYVLATSITDESISVPLETMSSSSSKINQYPNNMPYTKVAPAVPGHAYVQEQHRTEGNCYTGMMTCLGACIGGIGTVPILGACFPNPYKSVRQGHVGLVSEYGRFTRMVHPGLVYVNPLTESVDTVDTRIRVQILPPQRIFTHDNVSVLVDSVIYWKVADPATARFKVDGVDRALIERAQTTMREVCGIRDLQDMMTHREAMASEIKHIIESTASSWGIEIESILIKDIQMGPELAENFAAAAVAKRQGASKVISAQAEVEAARLMREASDIMATPAAMQFRYLETLQKMAANANSRVIFIPTSNDMNGVPSSGNGGNGRGMGLNPATHAALLEKI